MVFAIFKITRDKIEGVKEKNTCGGGQRPQFTYTSLKIATIERICIMNTERVLIHIQEETRAKLAADLQLAKEARIVTDDLSVDDLVSRAQAFPGRHLLDIMYQYGLKEAVKTLIIYYELPMVNFDQKYPMHYGFLSVFHFCGQWVASASYDDTNIDKDDLYASALEFKSEVNMLMQPDIEEEFWGKDFLNKQDFLDLLNSVRRNWYTSLFEFHSRIYMILPQILDFPAFRFADDPIVRIRFALWLRNLTACWPEDVWNWGNFKYW